MSSRAIEHFDDKARETFEHAGRTTVYGGELLRHPVYTRILHWTVALFFFLALFSGFGIYLPWLFRWFTPIFGGGQLSRIMHPYFGVAFVFFFALQALNWIQPMLWAPGDTRWLRNIKTIASGEEKWIRPTPASSMPAKRLCSGRSSPAASSTSSPAFILWAGAKTFGRISVAISYVLHDISALIMLGGIFIHIYLSTIGEPGTFHSMIRGAVSEAWAWTFHPAWYKTSHRPRPRPSLRRSPPPDERRQQVLATRPLGRHDSGSRQGPPTQSAETLALLSLWFLLLVPLVFASGSFCLRFWVAQALQRCGNSHS